jgi:hypothetical protein
VAIMVGFIVVGTAKWLFSSRPVEKNYERYRAGLWKKTTEARPSTTQ